MAHLFSLFFWFNEEIAKTSPRNYDNFVDTPSAYHMHIYMCKEFVNKFCMFLNIDVYSIPKFKKVSNTNFMKST